MKAFLITAAGALATHTAAHAGLLMNGGFESGDFSGWMYAGNTASAAVTSELSRDTLLAGQQPPLDGIWDPVEGAYFASLWSTDSVGGGGATLSTQFQAAAGQILSFMYFFDFGDFAPNYDAMTITLGWSTGSVVLAEHNTNDGNLLPDDTNIDWTPVSYTFEAGGTYTLTFSIDDADGFFESLLGVDDVFIPAPATVGLAPVCLVLLRRRTRH